MTPKEKYKILITVLYDYILLLLMICISTAIIKFIIKTI